MNNLVDLWWAWRYFWMRFKNEFEYAFEKNILWIPQPVPPYLRRIMSIRFVKGFDCSGPEYDIRQILLDNSIKDHHEKQEICTDKFLTSK